MPTVRDLKIAERAAFLEKQFEILKKSFGEQLADIYLSRTILANELLLASTT